MDGLIQRLSKVERSVLTVIAVALSIVLFLSVNVFAALTFGSARSDLTEGKLFTLTPSTVNVLKGIDEQITLRLFQSQALMQLAPPLNIYKDRVNELLRTYQELSGGHIRFERGRHHFVIVQNLLKLLGNITSVLKIPWHLIHHKICIKTDTRRLEGIRY